jgi:hypothetical protein
MFFDERFKSILVTNWFSVESPGSEYFTFPSAAVVWGRYFSSASDTGLKYFGSIWLPASRAPVSGLYRGVLSLAEKSPLRLAALGTYAVLSEDTEWMTVLW